MGGTEVYRQMLVRELSATKNQFLRLLKVSLEEAVATHEALGPLRVTSGPEKRGTYVSGTSYFCRFRPGDTVQLRVKAGNHTEPLLDGAEVLKVLYPAEGQIALHLKLKRGDQIRADQDCYLYPSLQTGFTMSVLAAMNKQETFDLRALHSPAGRLVLVDPERFLESLNTTQQEALRFLLENQMNGAVQGPPGTGKTHLLRAAVDLLLASKLTVGIAAYTHTAVDNALSRLAKVLQGGQFMRIGASIKIRSELYPQGFLVGKTADSFAAASHANLYAATVHSWVLSGHAPRVDVLILDEAGQVPSYMLPLLALKAGRFLMLGDHKQLPPVLTGKHSDLGPTDAFSFMIDGERHAPMLDTQYRMNSEIQTWSSRMYYEGRLKPHCSNESRDVISERVTNIVELGETSVQLRGHDLASEKHANEKEAAVAADIVACLLKNAGLSEADIGIITPHRMQAGLVSRKLQALLGPDVRERMTVDTVERFQGQEKEVILLSFGADTIPPPEDDDESAFLADPRRLNVAVTRAKSRFYCLASNRLLCAGDTGLREFLKWCGNASGY